MESFLSKKDINLLEERIQITSNKIKEKSRIGEEFMSNEDNLRSYVRIQYLLGEPCWGICSPVNYYYK